MNITNEQPEKPNEQPNIAEKVIAIIADKGCVSIETVTNEKTFAELGFDSLDNVELIMELENVFDVHISDTDMERILTVEDAIKFIESHK